MESREGAKTAYCKIDEVGKRSSCVLKLFVPTPPNWTVQFGNLRLVRASRFFPIGQSEAWLLCTRVQRATLLRGVILWRPMSGIQSVRMLGCFWSVQATFAVVQRAIPTESLRSIVSSTSGRGNEGSKTEASAVVGRTSSVKWA